MVEGTPASRGYAGGFATRLMVKDLKLAEAAAVHVGMELPMGASALHLYQQASHAHTIMLQCDNASAWVLSHDHSGCLALLPPPPSPALHSLPDLPHSSSSSLSPSRNHSHGGSRGVAKQTNALHHSGCLLTHIPSMHDCCSARIHKPSRIREDLLYMSLQEFAGRFLSWVRVHKTRNHVVHWACRWQNKMGIWILVQFMRMPTVRQMGRLATTALESAVNHWMMQALSLHYSLWSDHVDGLQKVVMVGWFALMGPLFTAHHRFFVSNSQAVRHDVLVKHAQKGAVTQNIIL